MMASFSLSTSNFVRTSWDRRGYLTYSTTRVRTSASDLDATTYGIKEEGFSGIIADWVRKIENGKEVVGYVVGYRRGF